MGSRLSVLKKFLIGALIGIVSTVPGVSGAVLAVCFGIYERIVADIADITHKIREDFRFLLTIGLGLAFGIVITSIGLDYFIENYAVASMMLFTGMILGQLPELWRFTEPEIKASKTNISAFFVGFAVMCLFLISFLIIGESEDLVLTHDLTSCFYMLLIGVIFAVSHLAPGISGATVLLAMGLYAALLSAIATFDLVLMVPLLIGIFVGLIGFAKVVHHALRNYRKSTYMLILGLTAGSVLLIVKEAVVAYSGTADIVSGAAALVAGIIISIAFSRLGREASKEFSAS
jgi:putative membrane protein